MKKLKTKWQMLVNVVLTTVLGWLAISCNNLVPMYGPLVGMYAPPAPRDLLQINGQVTNNENRILESMQVSCDIKYGKEWANIADAEYTDKAGNFTIYSHDVYPDTMRVIVKDTADIYKADTTIITNKDIKLLEENIILEDGWTVVSQVEVNAQLDKKE